MRTLTLDEKLYGGIAVLLVVLQVLFTLLLAPFLPSQQITISWLETIIYLILGYVGLRLATRSGFPEMMNPEINNKQRFVIPLLIGILFGAVTIIFDLINPIGTIHFPFPISLVVYPRAAILQQLLFTLFLVTFLVWLISSVILKENKQQQVFWGVATTIAIAYTLWQISLFLTYVGGLTPFFVVELIVLSGGFTLTAAYLYRDSGFLSAITAHLGQYLIWHIIWGGFAIALL